MCLAVCGSGPRLVAPETGEPPVRSFNCAANMLFSISSCRILLALLSDFGDDDADQTGEREGDRVGLEALLFFPPVEFCFTFHSSLKCLHSPLRNNSRHDSQRPGPEEHS